MGIRNSSVKVRQPNPARKIIAFAVDNRTKQRSCRDFTRRSILSCSFKYRQIKKNIFLLKKVCKPFVKLLKALHYL